jgi:hypothetical protein
VCTVSGVQTRTLQMTLPRQYRKAILNQMKDVKEKKIKAVEGCWIRKDTDGGDFEQLVSITGPKEKLKEAEAWVRGLVV